LRRPKKSVAGSERQPTLNTTTVTAPVELIKTATYAYANLINWQQCARGASNVKTFEDMERTQAGANRAREDFQKTLEPLNDLQRTMVFAAFRGNMAGMPFDIWKNVPDPVSQAWIEEHYPPIISEF